MTKYYEYIESYDFKSHNSYCVNIRVMWNHMHFSYKINIVRYDDFCLKFSAYNWGNMIKPTNSYSIID